MKGIKSKVITDEETVRMHTNFAEFKNVKVVAAGGSDMATWSKQDGVLRVHTNTIYSWGIYVLCEIPISLLKAGQKYCISVVSNLKDLRSFNLANGSGQRHATVVNTSWVGNRIYSVVTISEANIVNGLGIRAFLDKSAADYELSDFRIWEIDDATTSTGGAIVRFLSAVILNLAYAGRKEAA